MVNTEIRWILFFAAKDEEALCCCCSAAKSLQLCLTLCDPRNGSPSGSPVPGILQARTLEWVAISFSNAWKWKVKVKLLSRVQLLATPWTTAYRLLCPSDFPGKSTGVGCYCLLLFNVTFSFSRLLFFLSFLFLKILYHIYTLKVVVNQKWSKPLQGPSLK